MKNWVGIAQAHGLALPAEELDRVASPLAALDEAFRPLVKQLAPAMEPDLELRLAAVNAGDDAVVDPGASAIVDAGDGE